MPDQLTPIAAPFVVVLCMFLVVFRIRYVIDEAHVRVVLGRLTLRRIAIDDIAFVDTKAPFWNEHWCNTLRACGRVVRIRRKSGLIRNFIITPENRDDFLRSLEARREGRTGR